MTFLFCFGRSEMSKFVKSFHNKGEKAAADLAARAGDIIDLAAKTIPENREKDVVSNSFTNMVTSGWF